MTDRPGIDVVYQENRALEEEIERLRAEIERLHGLVASARNWIDPDEHQDWEEQASIEASSCQGTIERLTADRDQFERESCERFQQLDAALKRIEELENIEIIATNRGTFAVVDGKTRAVENGYIITTEQLASGEVVLLTQGQIDWAWRVASSEEPYTDDCLAELGIVACEECGGSGMIGNPSSSDQVCICHDCGGHGWVWKEVTKDEQ